jgi:hypothetical protein
VRTSRDLIIAYIQTSRCRSWGFCRSQRRPGSIAKLSPKTTGHIRPKCGDPLLELPPTQRRPLSCALTGIHLKASHSQRSIICIVASIDSVSLMHAAVQVLLQHAARSCVVFRTLRSCLPTSKAHETTILRVSPPSPKRDGCSVPHFGALLFFIMTLGISVFRRRVPLTDHIPALTRLSFPGTLQISLGYRQL